MILEHPAHANIAHTITLDTLTHYEHIHTTITNLNNPTTTHLYNTARHSIIDIAKAFEHHQPQRIPYHLAYACTELQNLQQHLTKTHPDMPHIDTILDDCTQALQDTLLSTTRNGPDSAEDLFETYDDNNYLWPYHIRDLKLEETNNTVSPNPEPTPPHTTQTI